MPRYDAHGADDEILQADVMRFMAIVAFCFIAVLALVQSAEPVQPRPKSSAPPVDKLVIKAEPPAEAAVAVPAPREPAPREPAPLEPEPPPRTAAAPEQPAAAERSPAVEPARAADPPTPRPAALTPPADPPAPVSTPPSARPSEQGLSLRFASDQDFLRLLNRGEIRVYAFHDGEVLAVGADLALRPASAPGELHELLPGTIPDLMADALRAAGRPDTFRWGVAMPERIARQINDYLARGVSGELIIDRFGEVRHRET